jgi:hypothetical protein
MSAVDISSTRRFNEVIHSKQEENTINDKGIFLSLASRPFWFSLSLPEVS